MHKLIMVETTILKNIKIYIINRTSLVEYAWYFIIDTINLEIIKYY